MKTPEVAPLHQWGVASETNQTMVQILYTLCMTFLGKMFLVTTDVYSKWLEVQVVKTAASHATIQDLQTLCYSWDS